MRGGLQGTPFHVLSHSADLIQTGGVGWRVKHLDPVIIELKIDPIQGILRGQSIRWNPYIYAGANPVNYIDPDGKFFWMPFLMAVSNQR